MTQSSLLQLAYFQVLPFSLRISVIAKKTMIVPDTDDCHTARTQNINMPILIKSFVWLSLPSMHQMLKNPMVWYTTMVIVRMACLYCSGRWVGLCCETLPVLIPLRVKLYLHRWRLANMGQYLRESVIQNISKIFVMTVTIRFKINFKSSLET